MYVGRVSDFRKGLHIFLDAISLLLDLKELPKFKTMIVGGAEDEAQWVRDICLNVPQLQLAMKNNDIEVWSRVEPYALSELYSRCNVICLPSLREQFGMVAVEAMMCGAPVVGTRTGGLQHIISHDLNGFVVDRLNPSALASALAIFIKNPNVSPWMAKNSQISSQIFSLNNVTNQYLSLYNSLLKEEPIEKRDGIYENRLHLELFKANIEAVENVISEKIIEYHDVSSGPVPSISIETETSKKFVKLFQKRPPSTTCVYSSIFEEKTSDLVAERVLVARKMSEYKICPDVVASSPEDGILVLEHLENIKFSSNKQAEELMLKACSEISKTIELTNNEISDFYNTITLKSGNIDTEIINAADKASAQLFKSKFDVHKRLRKCHPQIELLRNITILGNDSNLVPDDFKIRASSVMWFLLGQRDLLVEPPKLGHGSMKQVHLMQRPHTKELVICDMDHISFYVGPYDYAHWIYYKFKNSENPAPVAMCKAIKRLATNDSQSFLGAAWLAQIIISRAIWRFARGNWNNYQWDMMFLASFPDAYKKVFIP